ncbi:MAG: xylose isomerase, partial [Pseudomonadota bacterium]
VVNPPAFSTGGTNFDAKLRRQSLDPVDLIAAHAGAMDICARGLKAAAALLEDGTLEAMRAERYAGWDTDAAKAMLAGGLDDAAARVEGEGLDPAPRSGRQEILENIVNRFV